MIDQKVAIICGDGAIRGGYIAGVFFGLRKYNPEIFNKIAYLSGSSASVGGLFYETSFNDKNPGKEIWKEAFSHPEIVKTKNLFTKNPVYNIEFTVDEILKKEYSLDIEGLHNTRIDFYFPLIEYDTGKIIIFNNKIEKQEGALNFKIIDYRYVYDYIKAAISAPALYDNFTIIKGVKYIDAGARLPFLKIKNIGQHKKIVITTTGEFSMLESLKYRCIGGCLYIFGDMLGFRLKSQYYLDGYKKPSLFNRMIKESQQDKNTLHIFPQKKKLGSIFDNSRKTLHKNFEYGLQDAKDFQKEITHFLNS